jgi:hypothetical protein
VESGKLPSGQYAVSMNFGRDYSSYQEESFQHYARGLSEAQVLDGGLFMPLLIRKDHFQEVGGYPEGQVRHGSGIYNPVIAKRGEPCISGDTVLMMKLKGIGIKHQTAFDSIAYHFQWGELDSSGAKAETSKIKVAICNNLVTGFMGDLAVWKQLVSALPASVGIDLETIGNQGEFALNARKYIQAHHPEVEIIIQNASFIDTVSEERYTIAFLQDDLRSKGRKSKLQDENLRRARKRVTNSLQTALAYPEYDFEIIPDDKDASDKWHDLLIQVFQEINIAKAAKAAEIKQEIKKKKVSIIITTYKRTHLLRWGLYSLSQQHIPFEFETIVVNDGIEDESEAICNEFKDKLNLKYIFTGQRNLQGDPVWRVPGFAINIAAKQATGDILVMCCAEMFHLNNTIDCLVQPIIDNPKLLAVPHGRDDRDGAFLNYLTDHSGEVSMELYNKCIILDTRMPFLMALHRSQFLEIGGYDEDFVGIAYDDRDIIDRLLKNGGSYCQTSALTIHLFHPRIQGYYQGGGPPEWEYNKNLFFSRIGKVVRNEGREWGVPDK